MDATKVTAEDGIYWVQSPDSDEDFTDYPMLTPKALYGGSAGIGLFYLRLYQVTENEEYLKNAKSFGDFLLKKGTPALHVGRYWNVVDLTIIDFPKDVFWVNMAHGTSGIGWVYTILYNATKEHRVS